MPSQLNFARVPFRNERLPWLLYGLVWSVLVAVSVGHGVQLTRYLLREREELDAKVEALRKDVSELEARLRTAEQDLHSQLGEARSERIEFLAGLYRRKSISWTRLFNELETITPGAVRILALSPGEKSKVSLQVVGRSLEDVLEMVRRLEAHRLFKSVLPVNEDEADERVGGGVAATLTLEYVPGRLEGASVEGNTETKSAVKDKTEAGPLPEPAKTEGGADSSASKKR